MPNLPGAFWNIEVWGNTLYDYALAIAVFVGALIVLKIIKTFVVSRVTKAIASTRTHIDDAVLEVFDTIRPPFYIFLAFYGASRLLTLEGRPEKTLSAVVLMWVTWQVVAALKIFIDHIIRRKLAAAENASRKAVSGIISGIANIVLWVLGILFVLSNLGVNITSLVAGLGIGGLAFALAAQKLIEDLFASLAIYFDRPFSPGDFIKTGNNLGTVQRIGIKTTRIKALSGEEVAIPNKDITEKGVQNYKRMTERRVAFTIGVAYATPQEKLKLIPSMIKQVIDQQEYARFDRAHLAEFAEFALKYEVVYHVLKSDYALYMDMNQQILLDILQLFEQERIELAYPARSMLVKQEP